MFVYGSYRGFRANYVNDFIKKEPPLGTRMILSSVNGLLYGLTPYGCVKLIHILDRVDISMRDKESEYIDLPCYSECAGWAKNTYIL
jgi:hypothetical protein